jgi:hypothetical protein
VYENKGSHDKLPEKNSDFVSEIAKFARNFGVFARSFASFAHENRSWGGFMPAFGQGNSPLRRTPSAVASPEEQACPGMRLFDGPGWRDRGKEYAGASGDVYENKRREEALSPIPECFWKQRC